VVICLEQGANGLLYGPVDATTTPSFLGSLKCRIVLPFLFAFVVVGLVSSVQHQEIGSDKKVSEMIYLFRVRRKTLTQLEMWANAQRDGRPAEYKWGRLFNAAKFG